MSNALKPYDAALLGLHRIDLTKEERDNHIRRYAELIELRKVAQNEPLSTTGRGKKGTATKIAEETAEADSETNKSQSISRLYMGERAIRDEIKRIREAVDSLNGSDKPSTNAKPAPDLTAKL